MIPYGHQSINSDDIQAVVRVLKSNWLTQGPKVLEFEKALARYCGAKYAVAVANGTAALYLSYLIAGLKKGDEVITTPNTFVATTNMLLVVGIKPVFCDIRLDTYNIDETKIEKLITKKTKAIVSVHFAGHPCEMDKILKIAKKHKLLVIEDAAHALGAFYKKKKIGGLQSNLMIFSFHPVKSITTGEGGAILTNNKRYYKKLLLLRSHGIIKDAKGFNAMKHLGYNYRLTDIQAALGISQLKRLNQFIGRRQKIAECYQKELSGLKKIILPTELRDVKSSWHLYVIRVCGRGLRDKLSLYLRKNGIGISFHYPTVYAHPYYKQLGYQQLKLKNMEQYASECLTLSCYPGLSFEKVKQITSLIRGFLI